MRDDGRPPATDVVDEAARWLGWWAFLAGTGSVLARAIWTEGVAMAPLTAFWLWIGVMSFLLRGRFDAEGPAQ